MLGEPWLRVNDKELSQPMLQANLTTMTTVHSTEAAGDRGGSVVTSLSDT